MFGVLLTHTIKRLRNINNVIRDYCDNKTWDLNSFQQDLDTIILYIGKNYTLKILNISKSVKTIV